MSVQPATPRRSSAGFTLIELMVALTVGGIAISAIYAIGSASARVFYQQQQVANTQTLLRQALDQLKRDIARAGYLGTPRANLPGQSCGLVSAALHTDSTNPLAAFTRYINDVALNAGNNNDNVNPGTMTVNVANGFTVDDVVLIGNYETASEYPGVTLVNSGEIRLSASWHAFRRDFTDWHSRDDTNVANDRIAIERTFPPGRLIRIRLTNNLYHFATITQITGQTASPADDIQVRFTPTLDGACINAVDGAWLAPVSAIRYTVRNAPTNTLDAERTGTVTGPMAQLIREEVQPGDKRTPLNITSGGVTFQNRRAILDYVVGFNLEFTQSTTTILGARDQYRIGAATNDASLIDPNPERIRSVLIDVSVRTPEQDPTFQWQAAQCANQRCYLVFNDRPGAARVRRMRAEVFVPNLANEGY